FELFGVYPHLGPAAGGNSVTLTGQGLDGLTSVTIGGASASITSQNFSRAVVTVPARGGPRKANVVASDGSDTETLTDGYTYRLQLTSLSPNSGPSTGGTSISVVGSNFPLSVEPFLGPL